jgi:Bacillus haemolytic enterotoxin (HBL)
MPNLSKDDIAKLDTNYADIRKAIPDDLLKAFVAADKTLTANAVVTILEGSRQWLLQDGSNYYLTRVDGEKLDVYSLTSAAFSVLLTKSKMATGVTSIVLITNACHAILNTQLNLPDGMTKPKWFDGLVGKLDAAKALATEWINTLAPDLTASLPNKVINYDTQYGAITNQIIKIADANPLAQGPNDPNVKLVFQLISALKTQVGKIHDDIAAEDQKLLDWGMRMQTAHDNLSGGVQSIQAAEADLAADIGKMDADISRLHSEIEGLNKAICAAAISVALGIFTAIVGAVIFLIPGAQVAGGIVMGIGAAALIGGAVTWGIMQKRVNDDYDTISRDQKEKSADQAQLIALRGLEVATAQSVGAIATATSALSNVRALWKLFAGELEGVLQQLNQADTGLALIVNEAFVQGAQDEWKLAAELAQQLLNPVAVRVDTSLPMDVTVPDKKAA